MNPYTYSDKVYAAFGRAAHAAQLLEKQLATFLLMPEFQKKGTISTATFAKVQEELEKCPLGPLVNKMKQVVQLTDRVGYFVQTRITISQAIS